MDVQFDFPTAGLGPLPVLQSSRLRKGLSDLTAAWDAVLTLDLLIFKYAHLLDRVQPSAPGKLGVRFERSAIPATDGRKPIWVQWFRTTSRRGRNWDYKRLDQKSVLRSRKRYGPFASTEAMVAEVVRELSYLMDRRAAMVKVLTSAFVPVRYLLGVNARVGQAKQYQFDRWKPRVERERRAAIALWDRQYHGVVEQGAPAPDPDQGEQHW